jgi:hypothetical protein
VADQAPTATAQLSAAAPVVEGVVNVNEPEVIKMALEGYARCGRGVVCVIDDRIGGKILGRYVAVGEISKTLEGIVDDEYFRTSLSPAIEAYNTNTSCILLLVVYSLPDHDGMCDVLTDFQFISIPQASAA